MSGVSQISTSLPITPRMQRNIVANLVHSTVTIVLTYEKDSRT